MLQPDSHSTFRFGDFELDVSAYELRRCGQPVHLERQPMDLLILLVERHRQLVSRDDIVRRLWDPGVFVDVEMGVNTAIRKLRQALRDSRESPVFVETVSGKGYRFIAPVNAVPLGCQQETIESVAVLPFANDSADPDAEYLGDGITETLTNNLSQIWNLCATSLLKLNLKLVIPFATIPVLLLIVPAVWYSPPTPLVVTNTFQITNDRKAKIPTNLPVTDGLHLYFVEGQPFNSGSGIAQISTQGGETTWITTSLREVLTVADISPDRSKLLLFNGVPSNPGMAGELWIQPLPAGTPYRVGSIRPSSACFTPDGSHIVYGDKRVMMIANVDGSDPHPMASLPGLARAPRFSPDGRHIRFWVNQDMGSARSIWEMDATGKNLHSLLPNWRESDVQCCGAWSPDGDYYFFLAVSDKAQTIWVLPERRSILGRARAPFRLISGPLRFGAPSPSTDGKRLFVEGEETRVELFRYDPEAKRFDPYLGGLSAGPLDFSPDGKWIAYVSYPDMNLWRSRLDLSEKMQVTFPPVRAYEPRWSPDGSRIAFMDLPTGGRWTIRLLSAEGGNSPKSILPSNGNDSEADPTWTPDGKSIVFSKTMAAGEGTSAIYQLNLENGNLLRIPHSEGLFSPRLSPDGSFIAALTADKTKLMLFDRNRNQWSTLADGESFSYNEWSHDGKYIYVRENRHGSAELVRARIKDRVMEDVLNLKDFPALSDQFANWIGLTPDGGALLMRDRSVQEIYALDLRIP